MYNLEKKSDPELVKEIKKTNANEPFLELFNRHVPLFTDIVNGFSGKFYASGIPLQDIIEDKYVVFLNAINSYNEDKNTKFSSWLGQCAKYHCLNTLYKNNDYNKFKINDVKNHITDDDETNQDNYNYLGLEVNEFDQISKNEELDYIIKTTEETIKEVAAEAKDNRISDIFDTRFDKNSDKNTIWKKVGKKTGLSYQGALNIFNANKEKIKNRVSEKILEKKLDVKEVMV